MMSPAKTTVTVKAPANMSEQVDSAQTLRASTALLRKIQSDKLTRKTDSEKISLLADADNSEEGSNIPIWLILTTKKHIIDQQRLKPGKIVLPHPTLNTSNPNLKICLITADPQRAYKDLIAHPSFPLDLSKCIARVIGLSKLKLKYKSYESRRQLLSEYDVFLADDRVVVSLAHVLGKVFYKSGAKRPVPIDMQGKRQNFDDQGNKRRKLAEGGTKVTRSEPKPIDVANEIRRALSSALVHLAPSTTTAVKVGTASMEPQQLQENTETVIGQMVEKYVPQKWRNVRAIHVKGPETAALPIWLAEELWETENDVLEEPLPPKEKKKGKKRQRDDQMSSTTAVDDDTIEVPGPDGKMRRLEKPSAQRKLLENGHDESKAAKKQKRESVEQVETKNADRIEKAARKEALQRQKAAVKSSANGVKGKRKSGIAISA